MIRVPTILLLEILALSTAAPAQIEAAFTATPTAGPSPLTVQFTDLTTGEIPVSNWFWNFGDGSAPSLEQHPVHVFKDPGVFSVSLSVIGGVFFGDAEFKDDYITVGAGAVEVDFAVFPAVGPQPLVVAFQDLSTSTGPSPDAWLWAFGDGCTSTDQHPVHEYWGAGAYDVSLTAFVNEGPAKLVKPDAVMVEAVPQGDISLLLGGAAGCADGPYGLAVGEDGSLYVAAGISDGLYRVHPHGEIELVIDGTSGEFGLDLPRRVAVGPFGRVYVSGANSSNVLALRPGGPVAQVIGPAGDGQGNPLVVAEGLAVDRSGSVYVASEGGSLFKVQPNGVVAKLYDSLGGIGEQIDVDRGGNVYVSDESLWTVIRIAPDGSTKIVIDESGDGVHPLERPRAVKVDHQGNVYVAGNASNNVFRISRTGHIREILDASGDGQGNKVLNPHALDVDSAGNVYVANQYNALRVSPDGAVTVLIDETGDGQHEYFVGRDIRFVAPDTVYVTASTSDAVFRIRLGNR